MIGQMEHKPGKCPVKIENLPDSLKKEGLFCLWKYEPDKKGKPTKVPYDPNRYNRRGDPTDPEKFAPLQTALNAFDNKFSGLGVGVFNNLCGIDIDHCVDDAGNLTEFAQDIIDTMGCYTEFSPSGKGLRILCLTHDFDYNSNEYYINNQKKGLEVYVPGMTKRFLTVTGNVFNPGDLEDRTEQAKIIVQKYMKREKKKNNGSSGRKKNQKNTPSAVVNMADADLIEKAKNAENGSLFATLWDGGIANYGSQSEADLALCNLLAFWTACDPVRMDDLFRQSGLFREKWDEDRGGKTYGQITIENVIDTYSGAVYGDNLSNTNTKEAAANERLQPYDYTDIGQAAIFVQQYKDVARYSLATKWICYDGIKWTESDLKAQGFAQDLTNDQLNEARKMLKVARAKLDTAIEAGDEEKEKTAKENVKTATAYRKFVLDRRKSSRITATLTEARPRLEVDVNQLDADPFVLNTPGGTVDLRTGAIRKHDPHDLITKATAVAPSHKGEEIWQDFLDKITCGDKELQEYHQRCAGMILVGKVFVENLLICHGLGGNGKSTYFNALFLVLGDYAGSLSAETLTTGCRKNRSPELAELRGKRFIVAAELSEGTRLDTSIVKKICSTDPILAERKFKDPFTFIPSHTVVLFTNHLPKVGTNDKGTWDRLVVVPFLAKLRGETGEIKNYADYLFNNCGGAILSWMIEGAISFIKSGFIIEQPTAVKEAIEEYRHENDWVTHFITECCEVGIGKTQSSGHLYKVYRDFCSWSGEYCRHSADFKAALSSAGYESKRTKNGIFYYGLELKEWILCKGETPFTGPKVKGGVG